jgi:hypothetical protein
VRPNARENDQITPQPPFELPQVRAVVRATRLSCQNARKAQKFTPVRGSSGESQLMKTQAGRTAILRNKANLKHQHKELVMTTEQIENLTMQDVANAKTAAAEARKTRSGVSTVVFHLSQVTSEHGDGRSLDNAKAALIRIAAKA